MIARHSATEDERNALRLAAVALRRAANVHQSRMDDPDFKLSLTEQDGERRKCLIAADMAEHLCVITESR